jgi:hypothetical protein
MALQEAVRAFFQDDRLAWVLLLLALDFVLGAGGAVLTGKFRLSYVADFARNDLLGKVFPWFVLYLGYKYAPNTDIVIPGFDLEILMNAAWVALLAAMAGSILGSLKEFGVPLVREAPAEIAGPDPATPVVP